MLFEKNIRIKSSKNKVWEYLTVFEKAQEWNECLLESKKISNGDIKEGFKSKNLIKEGKKSIWYDEEITDIIPNEKLTLKISGENLGKNPMISTFQLTENKNEVLVNQKIEWQPSGMLLKLLHRMITKMSEKNVENDLYKLKKYLEEK